MLIFVSIMVFILIVIFILPKYNHKKAYKTAPNAQPQYANSTSLLALKIHQKNETINLFGYEITNSLFYTCELNSFIPFAVNINAKPDFTDILPEKLACPPDYNELDKTQQGYFIKWLANGKPFIDDMGYVYLYYYGLEYRALAEKKDRKAILFEVIKLVTTFKKLRYGYDFIIYLTLALSFSELSQEEKNTLKIFYEENKQKYTNTPAYHAIIKKLSPKTQYIPAFSPSQLLDTKEYEKLSTRKCELLEYYFQRALEKFNETELYTTEKKPFTYHAAMKSACIDTFGLAHNAIFYDALIPNSKTKKLYRYAQTIIKEEIKQTLKNFNNSAAPLTEIEKYLYLPAALQKDITPPKLLTIADKTIAKIEAIADKLGFAIEETITLRQSILLAEACEALGFEIEPSAVLEKKAYKNDEMVILYENQFIKKSSSEQYQTASLFTDIGYQIALEDSELLQTENTTIEDFIKKEFTLSPAEYYRLQMRGKLIAHTQKIPADNTIKKLIKTASNNIKETIIQFALAIAGNDGIIKEKEFRLLQKIARQLSISKEQLNSILAQFINTAEETIVLEKLSKTQKNTKIAPFPKTEETIKLQLNTEKLAEVQLNTAEIQTVLQEIFGEEQNEALQSEPQESSISEETPQNCLENNLQDIVTLLLEKETWTRNELLNIIQDKGILLNSVLDQINEWAENEFGDFLIEENEDFYTINSDVASLIQQNNEG